MPNREIAGRCVLRNNASVRFAPPRTRVRRNLPILHKDVDNMSLVVGHMWSRMFGDFLIGAVVFIGLASIDLKLAIVVFTISNGARKGAANELPREA